jgi:GNAT superfamily N-acetyltransferase
VTLDVRPLAPADEDDLVALFGTRGDPAWCWCQFFVTTGGGYSDGPRAERVRRNKPALLRQVRSSERPLGVLARDDGEPVGWLALGPVPSYARLTASPSRMKVTEAADDVWSTTCFVVKVGHRRRGVSSALLAAGIELARDNGARVLEGHPVDPTARTSKTGSAELYHGVASTFRRAGFTEVARTGGSRPVLRLEL